MSMRRFKRLTNGFSTKNENLAAMVAIYFMHHNFARIRESLAITPAMAAGLSDHVWSLEEIVLLANRATIRNQCRLTIAVQKARVGIERVVFPLFQVS
jgi:hypothetical protein